MKRHVAVAGALVAVACASHAPKADRSLPGAAELSVPDDGSELLFAGHAEGVQVYSCAAKAGGGYEWKLKGPDAEVTASSGEKLKHYAGPTWEAADGSKVVGEAKARAQVDATAVPWLLLSAKSTDGSGLLAKARWIQRAGSSAPTRWAARRRWTAATRDTRAPRFASPIRPPIASGAAAEVQRQQGPGRISSMVAGEEQRPKIASMVGRRSRCVAGRAAGPGLTPGPRATSQMFLLCGSPAP
jgi:hypothetical protein